MKEQTHRVLGAAAAADEAGEKNLKANMDEWERLESEFAQDELKRRQEAQDDAEKAERYGCASLDRAKNEFDHRRVVGEYLKMYDELWSGRS